MVSDVHEAIAAEATRPRRDGGGNEFGRLAANPTDDFSVEAGLAWISGHSTWRLATRGKALHITWASAAGARRNRKDDPSGSAGAFSSRIEFSKERGQLPRLVTDGLGQSCLRGNKRSLLIHVRYDRIKACSVLLFAQSNKSDHTISVIAW
jgi:hypothetical protein